MPSHIQVRWEFTERQEKGFVYFEVVSRAALGLNVPSSLR